MVAKRTDGWIFVVFFLVVAVDQLTKQFAIQLAYPVELIPGIFRISYITNTGSAFGLFPDASFILGLLGLAVLIPLLIIFIRLPNLWLPRLGMLLVMAGTFGNTIDRLWLGHVVDMFDFRFFPAFNIADSALTFGIVIMVYWYLMDDRNKN